MKIYRALIGGGVDVHDEGSNDYALQGSFAWGDQSGQAASLARALLNDLVGEGMRATRLYRRFMHRSVSLWPKGELWVANENELMEIVRAIESVEKEMAGTRAQMTRERPQLLIDAPAPGMVWDNNPDLAPNKPKE